MHRLLVVTLLAVTPRLATADDLLRRPPPPPEGVDLTAAARFTEQLVKGDVEAAVALLRPTLQIGALWFDDESCTKQFARPRAVDESNRAALVNCLIAVKPKDLEYVGRRLAIVFEDNVLFGLAGDRAGVSMIEPIGASPDEPAIRTVAGNQRWSREIEKFQTSSVTGRMIAPGQDPVTATLRVCANAAGKVTKADLLAESGNATYDRAALAAATRWTRKPFKVRHRAVALCEILTIKAYADGSTEGGVAGSLLHEILTAPPPPPPPPPPPTNIAPTVLEQSRIAGEREIRPDGPTFEKIVASGHRRVIGSFKLCIDASGKIISVSRLRSTGFVGYDATIINTIRNTWSYRPFTVNGKPVPVCTAVTFIYSLR